MAAAYRFCTNRDWSDSNPGSACLPSPRAKVFTLDPCQPGTEVPSSQIPDLSGLDRVLAISHSTKIEAKILNYPKVLSMNMKEAYLSCSKAETSLLD